MILLKKQVLLPNIIYMSTLNHIQKALLEMDGGSFQKLADAYLHKKGYENINALGSVIAADKVKTGTPDTFVPLENGKFVFAEYTTQQADLSLKISKDLDKCLNPEKTGISSDQIEEVIFCFNSELDQKKQSALLTKCQANNIKCSLYGIDAIAFGLYQNYPKLAQDFLGIDVDTGQIVGIEDFVTMHDKNRLSVKLDIRFHFRSQELEDLLKALDENVLLILSGKPGVGKSRLALEVCRQFESSHDDYQTLCIINRGPDIYNDLRSYFSAPGNYLIMIDDANRLTGLNYIIDLLMHKREDQNFKIVMTVRDYALQKVMESAAPLSAALQFEIKSLSEEDIKNLLRDEFNIKNQEFLTRIYEISEGNVRLAVMAAEVVQREGGILSSINNVSALYDEFFASIRRDLEKISEENLLKVSGIVSFFRHIDRSNADLMKEIYLAFDISEEEFWESVKLLHDLELFDMYEDEVVRFSDQVLANYLFYLAFFKEKIINFEILVNSFFPRFRSKMVDAINPSLSNFDTDEIISFMIPVIEHKWNQIKNLESDESLNLLEVFWFLDRTKTLGHIQKIISGIEPTALTQDINNITADSSIPSPSIMNVLSYFSQVEDNNFEIALRLLLQMLKKSQSDLGKFFYILADRYCFNHRSVYRNYSIQKIVIDVLWEQAENGNNSLFSHLFIDVSEKYLRTRYHVTEPKGDRAITMIDFHLAPTPELISIRQNILNNLFALYEKADYKRKVIDVIDKYSKSGIDIDEKEVIEEDSKLINSFIDKLDPSLIKNCLLANDYFDFLESYDITFSDDLKKKFQTDSYKTFELFEIDRLERKNLGISYHEFEELRKNKIQSRFKTLTFSEAQNLIDQCKVIIDSLGDQSAKVHQVKSGLCLGLIHIADCNAELYQSLIDDYLAKGDPLNYQPFALVEKLINMVGSNKAFEIINNKSFATKRDWLFMYYITVPESEISKNDLEILYSLYKDAIFDQLPRDLDYLLKFVKFDSQILIKVTEQAVKKAEVDPVYLHALSHLFNSHTEVNKQMIKLFSGRYDLLKKLYFLCLDIEQYFDYDGVTFCSILEVDSNFAKEYIEYMFSSKEWLSPHDDHRDYSFIWLRQDYADVMRGITQTIYDHEKDSLSHSFLQVFFRLRSEDQDIEIIIERQDELLEQQIRDNIEDSNFIEFVFELLTEETFSFDRKLKLLPVVLSLNKNIDLFERMPLLPSSMHWSGSAVPVIQKQIDDLEKVLPLLGTVELLQHKLNVEERINLLRKRMEAEKKRDFMGFDS